MIQFNLLPDVKLKYIKAERQKRLVLSVATIVIVASLVLLAFLILTVNVVQKKSINDLGRDIEATAAQLSEVEDLDKILTVQSQLNSLDGLHDQKVVSSRLYSYLKEVTPASVTISGLKVNFVEYSMEISGFAQTFTAVNKYADSLKFTTYQAEDGQSSAAFANVVLSTFSRQEEGANYTFTLNFDPRIFSGQSAAKLEVPNITTTAPGAERPQPLFDTVGEAVEEE